MRIFALTVFSIQDMINLPTHLREAIRDYILERCKHAEEGWQHGFKDEDTLTGDYLSSFRKKWTFEGNYRFAIGYHKTRSRGEGALEKLVGADALITLEFFDGTDLHRKSLAFQAKKINGGSAKEQKEKMDEFFPKGNTVVTYGPDGYFAKLDNGTTIRMCELIAKQFLECQIGVENVYYDNDIDKLVLDGKIISTLPLHLLKIKAYKRNITVKPLNLDTSID